MLSCNIAIKYKDIRKQCNIRRTYRCKVLHRRCEKSLFTIAHGKLPVYAYFSRTFYRGNTQQICHHEYCWGRLRVHLNTQRYVWTKRSRNVGILLHCKKIAPFEYTSVRYTPGLWINESRPATFTSCIDDFGIKYNKKEDLDHQLNILRSKYEISTDYTRGNYIDITIDWHYEHQ